MTDDEYQQALGVLQSLLIDEQWEAACHLRNAIRRTGRHVPASDRDAESPTMAIMRRVHKDMKAGVSVQRSGAVDELLSFMGGAALTTRRARQRPRELTIKGKARKG
jgi:hypothetical protein